MGSGSDPRGPRVVREAAERQRGPGLLESPLAALQDAEQEVAILGSADLREGDQGEVPGLAVLAGREVLAQRDREALVCLAASHGQHELTEGEGSGARDQTRPLGTDLQLLGEPMLETPGGCIVAPADQSSGGGWDVGAQDVVADTPVAIVEGEQSDQRLGGHGAQRGGV